MEQTKLRNKPLPLHLFKLLQSLQLLLLKNVTHNLNVSRYNSQGNIALKPFYPMVETAIQTMVFQSVYGGLHRRMLSPSLKKRFGILDFFIDSRQLPFAGKDDLI